MPGAPYDPPLVELSEEEVRGLSQTDEEGLLRIAERLCGHQAPASGSTHEKLQALLAGNHVISTLFWRLLYRARLMSWPMRSVRPLLRSATCHGRR